MTLMFTPLIMFALCLLMIGTSFLSGIFGMAGGMILIGVLLAIMPVPEAMALHAITQMASNGWRGLLWFRHIEWRAAAKYLAGCAVAMMIWSVVRYVPSLPVALLFLGLLPFAVRCAPAGLKPDPSRLLHGLAYGSVSMTVILLTGVAGPLIDTYFLGGNMDRRQIIATKAVCQILSHGAKLAYFSGIVDQSATVDPIMATLAVASSMIGTTLARRILEAMTDVQYRRWAWRIITVISGYYVLDGLYLLLTPLLLAQ